MKAIRLWMDARLLAAVDREAKKLKTDRSKLIRAATTKYVSELRKQDLEESHRKGHEKRRQMAEEIAPWLAIQSWPEG